MDETTETNMVYGEFKAFKNEWLKKWRPAIGEGCIYWSYDYIF